MEKLEFISVLPRVAAICLMPAILCTASASGNDANADGSTTHPASSRASQNTSISAHPRLYLNADKINFLKVRIAANAEPYTAQWSVIKSRADNYASETPPVYPTDPLFRDGNVDNLIRNYGNRLPFIAMAYLMTDDVKYFNGAKKWMDALASYTKWGNDHDLGAAHLLYNMAIVYDWLYNGFSPSDRAIYEQKMEYHLKIFAGIMEKHSTYWMSELSGNHNHVNVTSVMTAAVATYDSLDNADYYIQLAYDNFTKVLAKLRTDGSTEEGISYWSYSMEALLRYFDIETSVTGVNRMLTSPTFRRAPLYRLYASLPNYRNTILTADSVRTDFYGPTFILWRLAATFNDPRAQWLANSIQKRRRMDKVAIDSDWRTLIWYDENVAVQSPENLPTYHLFDDLELFTSRSAWSDDNAILLTLKAGPPMGHSATGIGPAHTHPDEGAFTVDGFGRNLIIDDGYVYSKLTSNHNVVTFDNIGQLGEGSPWFNNRAGGTADIAHTDFNEVAGYEYLIADLKRIYPWNLEITKYLRHFYFLKKKTLFVVDEIESAQVHEIQWRLHLNNKSTFAVSGSTLSGKLTGTNIGLVLDDISQEGHSYTLEQQVATSVNSFKNKTFQLKKLDRKARIEVVIRPYKGNAPLPLEYTRTGENIILKLDDGSFTSISTATKQVKMDINLNQNKNYIEGAARVALDDIQVTDPDPDEQITATLTLATQATGALSAGSGNGEKYDPATGVWTVTGTVAQVNAALAALEFLPAPENDVNTTVAVDIRDGLENGATPRVGTINLNVTPINDPPMATSLDHTHWYHVGVASVPLYDIVVSAPTKAAAVRGATCGISCTKPCWPGSITACLPAWCPLALPGSADYQGSAHAAQRCAQADTP